MSVSPNDFDNFFRYILAVKQTNAAQVYKKLKWGRQRFYHWLCTGRHPHIEKAKLYQDAFNLSNNEFWKLLRAFYDRG